MSDTVIQDPKPERRPKLADRLVAELRSQVVAGKLAAGQKLPTESRLTETYGVSRTVVREAIAALAADGLVEPRQGAGVFVVEQPASAFSALSLEVGNKISHALNVLEVRMGIEIESAGLAAQRRNSAQEAQIYEAYAEFDRLLTSRQATGKSDFAIHRAIAAATNNPFYVEVLDALGSRTIPCDISSPWGTESVLTVEYQVRLQREHWKIIKAVSDGDPQGARDAMRSHLSASQQRYRDRLAGFDPADSPIRTI